MAHVTLELLKANTLVTDDQLALVCSDDHLNKTAEKINNYLQYAHALHLKAFQTSEIDQNIKLTFLMKTQYVLLRWKNDNLYTATYLELVNVARELGESIVTETLCELCRERTIVESLSPSSIATNTAEDRSENDEGDGPACMVNARHQPTPSLTGHSGVTTPGGQPMAQNQPKKPAHFASMYWGLNECEKYGTNELIAVLDTGANTDHDALKRQVKFSKSFVGPEADCGDTDRNCHGTAVASVAAGKHLSVSGGQRRDVVENFSGFERKIPLGVAREASLVVFSVGTSLECFDPTAVANALEWIVHHNNVVMKPDNVDMACDSTCSLGHDRQEENVIRVVNMSFRLAVDNLKIKRFINKLNHQRVICIGGVGNGGNNDPPGWPALYSNILTVGSVNKHGGRSSFSTNHRCVDVYTLGEDVLVARNTTEAGTMRSAYGIVSGTSFATPAVAGLVAILLQCAREQHSRKKLEKKQLGPALESITDLDVLKNLFEKHMTVELDTPKGHLLLQPTKVREFFTKKVNDLTKSEDLDSVVRDLFNV